MKSILKTFVIIGFALLALASATTPQERLARNQARCASYGHAYGSESMANCVERIENEASRQSEKTLYCLNAYQLGTPAYFSCLAR